MINSLPINWPTNVQLNSYFVLASIFLAVLILLRLIKKLLLGRLRALAMETGNKVDDFVIEVVTSIGWIVYLVLPLYVSTRFVYLSPAVDNWISKIAVLVLVYYGVVVFQKIAAHTLEVTLARREQKSNKEEEGTLRRSVGIFLKQLLRILIWVIAIFFVLQNLGVNITALLGGVGILGIAVGFSLQNILDDIFSFFSIYFDQPFRVGDFIAVDDFRGTVDQIGIKSTRIETLKGSQVIVSNNQLIEKKITNYRTMDKRRVSFTVRAAYGTSQEKLVKIAPEAEEIVKNLEKAEFDRCYLKDFGDYGFNFAVVFYIASGDYNTYINARQKFNLALLEFFEKEGIEFGYPGRSFSLRQVS